MSSFDEEMEESYREMNADYLFRKKGAEYEKCAPYDVCVLDQFDSDSFGTWAVKDDLAVAIAAARQITEEAIESCKGGLWHGMGDVGLVYDCTRKLVWDGVAEYAHARRIKELIDQDYRGIRRICEAIDFAGKAHEGQFRKGTKKAYITHPLSAANLLLSDKCPPETVIAAVLHDTVEDTSVTIDDIRKKFGDAVAGIVKGTSASDKAGTWEDRKRCTIESVKTAPLNILLVEIADKLSNIWDIEFELRTEGEALWSKFNRPKEQQKWYYTSLAQVLSERKDNEVVIKRVKYFVEAVTEVFGDDRK